MAKGKGKRLSTSEYMAVAKADGEEKSSEVVNNMIPKSELRQFARDAFIKLRKKLQNQEATMHDKTPRELVPEIRSAIDNGESQISEAIDSIRGDGIEYKEDLNIVCDEVKKIVSAIRKNIQAAGRRNDKSFVIPNILKPMATKEHTDVRRKITMNYKLPSKNEKYDEVIEEADFRELVKRQSSALVCKYLIKPALESNNSRSIKENPNFHVIVYDIIAPLVMKMMMKIEALRQNAKYQFNSNKKTPNNWSARETISELREGLSELCEYLKEKAEEHPEDKEIVQFIGHIRNNLTTLGIMLVGFSTNDFVRAEACEDCEDILKVFTDEEVGLNEIYVYVRDDNLRNYPGEYESAFKIEDLDKDTKRALMKTLEDIKNESGFYDLDTEEAKIVSTTLNVDLFGGAEMFLPEDIVALVEGINEEIQKEEEEDEEEEREKEKEKRKIEELLRNSLNKFFRIALKDISKKILKAIRKKSKKKVSEYAPISRDEYEVIEDFFKQVKENILRDLEKFLETYFHKVRARWKLMEEKCASADIKERVTNEVQSLVDALKQHKISIKESDLNVSIDSIHIDLAQIINDVNYDIPVSKTEDEPNVTALLHEELVYSQDPNKSGNYEWLKDREFEEEEVEIMKTLIATDPEITDEALLKNGVEKMIEQIKKNEESESKLQSWVNIINEKYYCGLPVRDMDQLAQLVFTILWEKYEKAGRETDVSEINIDPEIRGRAKIVLNWVESNRKKEIPEGKKRLRRSQMDIYIEHLARHLEEGLNTTAKYSILQIIDLIEKLELLKKIHEENAGKKTVPIPKEVYARLTKPPEGGKGNFYTDRIDGYLTALKGKEMTLQEKLKKSDKQEGEVKLQQGRIATETRVITSVEEELEKLENKIRNLTKRISELLGSDEKGKGKKLSDMSVELEDLENKEEQLKERRERLVRGREQFREAKRRLELEMEDVDPEIRNELDETREKIRDIEGRLLEILNAITE